MTQALKGGLWKVGAGVCFAVINLAIRHVNVPAAQLAFMQNILGFIFLWLILRPRGFLKEIRWQAWAGGAASALGTLLFIPSIKGLPLIYVVGMGFLGPLLTALGACMWLGERFGLWRKLAVVFGVMGGIILGHGQYHAVMARGGDAVEVWRLVFPMGAAVAFSLCGLFSKKLVASQKPEHVALYWLALIPLFLLPIGLFAHLYGEGGSGLLTGAFSPWIWPDASSWGWIAVLAGLTVASYICVNRAYSYADMTFLIPLGTSRLVASALLGWWVCGEMPTRWTGFGALSLLGVLWMLSKDLREEKRLRERNQEALAQAFAQKP